MCQPDSIAKLFHSSLDDLGVFVPIEVDEMPQAFQSLLAHHDHMTVTVEAWHNSLVELRVLNESRQGDFYARQILLLRQRDGAVVQFGIMQIDLAGLPQIVRMEIESQALPLGRILIRHHMMREVELCHLWAVQPAKRLRSLLQMEEGETTFGRTARILVKGKPVVELLEIVRTP